MPIRKWLIQYCIALPTLIIVFAGIQYLKGRSIDYAIEFGIVWAIVSIAIFAARRVYMFRMMIPCALCNDFPESKKNDSNDKDL